MFWSHSGHYFEHIALSQYCILPLKQAALTIYTQIYAAPLLYCTIYQLFLYLGNMHLFSDVTVDLTCSETSNQCSYTAQPQHYKPLTPEANNITLLQFDVVGPWQSCEWNFDICHPPNHADEAGHCNDRPRRHGPPRRGDKPAILQKNKKNKKCSATSENTRDPNLGENLWDVLELTGLTEALECTRPKGSTAVSGPKVTTRGLVSVLRWVKPALFNQSFNQSMNQSIYQ